MSFLNQAFAVINTREGSAIYHILALFALEAAFAFALGHRRQMGAASNATRLAIAAGLAGLLRALTFVIGALGAYGLFSAPAVLAPLDRAVTLTMLLLLGWALVFRPGNRWADLLVSFALVVVFVAYIVAGIDWYPLGAAGTVYNATLREFPWEIAKVAAIGLILLSLIIFRPMDWGLTFGLFLILLAGAVYHLIDPVPTDNYPAPQRVAEMAALPLFAVIVYRHVLASAFAGGVTGGAAVAPQPLASGFKPRGLTPESINALASLNAVTDRQDIVTRITTVAGKTLMADVTLLFNPPKPDGLLACLGAYDQLNNQYSPGFIVPADKASVLSSAIIRTRPVRLRLPARQSELNHIADALSLDQIGSALMMPLVGDDHNYGAVMIGSISADKEWTGEDQALLGAMVGPIVAAIVGNQRAIAQADRLQHELDEAAMRVEAAQQEIKQLTRELEQVREQGKRHQQQAESLASIIKAGAAEPSMTSAEVAALQASYRRALEDLAVINSQLAEAQAEIEKLRLPRKATADQEAQIGALAQQLATTQALADERTREVAALRARLAETQSQLNQSRATEVAIASKASELAMLNEQLTKAQTLAADREGELTILTAQLAAAQEEVEQLRAELTQVESSAPSLENTADIAALNEKLAVAQNELMQLRVKLTEADLATTDTSQSAMLLSLIQDLRQPMSSIVGYTDLLLSESVGILGALQRSFLERIKASIERMTGLLNDLIQVTAIDSGKLRLDQQHVGVTEAIEDAFTGVGAQFREKNISLNMDVAEDLPNIEADRDAILQILSRLLTNACAASPPGAQVDVTAAMQPDNFLLVSVRDTGGGISAADQPRVFARTYRADRPLISGLGDTGFGLSIAKALTEAQGGRIWVESQQGVGSTFSVLLLTNGHR